MSNVIEQAKEALANDKQQRLLQLAKQWLRERSVLEASVVQADKYLNDILNGIEVDGPGRAASASIYPSNNIIWSGVTSNG